MNLRLVRSLLRTAGLLVLPLMAANLINMDIPVTESVFDPCSNEVVDLLGSAHLVGDGTVNNNTVHVIAQVSEQLTGTGEASGASYRVNATAHAEFNIDVDPVTNTGEETFPLATEQLIGQGNVPNANVQLFIHVTVNADGTLTASIDHIRASCH